MLSRIAGYPLTLIRRLFPSASERFVASLDKTTSAISAYETPLSTLTDEHLSQKTQKFKQRLSQGETLDDLLEEAFAVVREATKRLMGLRLYDVQMKGGIILHKGMISEMKTGEGKTLVAALPVYLNALKGEGVHVITVNDYLAQRDAETIGVIYKFLGLSVGCIVAGMTDEERRAAYHADVTYGTNNEFGFDWLRDNMKNFQGDKCQRPFSYAIVDEVDSILIDEARTPLIISGPRDEDVSHLYTVCNTLIPLLQVSHYEKDEKSKNVTLTEEGTEYVETWLKKQGVLQGDSLYDYQNIALVHHLNQALKAHKIFVKDVDYMVKNKKVLIIDEFTGRTMEGRRYSDGLHQALESKENVSIEAENVTLASVTFQNYFRLYPKLSGMTGTALTEEKEFQEIYNLKVIPVPTHLPIQRQDHDDEIYRTFQEKMQAIIAQIQSCMKKQQPVLVGTASIEKSEVFSQAFHRAGIKHQVLNARHHEKEAYIIAKAGIPGAVTIATNMAGRGTDIQLGGNITMMLQEENIAEDEHYAEKKAALEATIQKNKKQVLASGGLYVLGTERHESRRIDNQLRGRSGRQGDPGESKFFLCLEDDLMRIFGSQRLDVWLGRAGLKPNEAITHPWINKAIERAQKRVEARNFDMRKHLLKYDNVMNDQRQALYSERDDLLNHEDMIQAIQDFIPTVAENIAATYMPESEDSSMWQLNDIGTYCQEHFACTVQWRESSRTYEDYLEDIEHSITQHIQQANLDKDAVKYMVLYTLDEAWRHHLVSLDYLRQGIHLQAYGQKDPLNEYKKKAFEYFDTMVATWHHKVLSLVCQRPQMEHMVEDTIQKVSENLGRNDVCSCGSGKRFKHCCGRLDI